MSEEKAKELGLEPLFEIVAHHMASGHPSGIASIPGFAAAKCLEKAGLTVDDLELIEVNEAFAVMPLLSTAILAGAIVDGKYQHTAKVDEVRAKCNVNGGAIAIGHPNGASGTRITWWAMKQLEKTGGRYGCISSCCGGGQGSTAIIENLRV